LIELLHIQKRFGGTLALDDVSLSLAPGERLGLVGENGAGKSSLMNVLYGLYRPDVGEIRVEGKPAGIHSPQDALELGIGMVHQHFTLVPTLTVAENVVLGHEPKRGFIFDEAAAVREVEATCKRLGFVLDPRAVVSTLTVGSQQKVEIVKALHRGAKTVILDEPTAVLTPQEAEELFQVTRALSAQGHAVVLISHKLKEVLAFATRVAVMRKGKKVADDLKPETASPADLAALMIGESGLERTDPSGMRAKPAAAGDVVLALENVSAPRLHGVSLQLRAGEILGIAGVDGNGQRELAEVITGLLPFTGALTLKGQRFTALSPGEARARGVAHIPEDRLRRAIVPDLSVEENAALGRHAQAPFAKGAFIDTFGRRLRTEGLLSSNDVRPREPALRMGGLSGGNQQKLVVGRELDSQPSLLVVVQPTRGLDIAAVEAVRTRLLAVARGGCAVLLVSLDLDEVLAVSDRVLVMYGGKLNGEFARDAFDERAMGQRMLGAA
jgi:general nucleoside transport system ATP-binding protein